MRRVRNPLGNKENFCNFREKQTNGNELQSLQRELKAAQMQITTLQESNLRLQEALYQRVDMKTIRKMKKEEANWKEEKQFMEEQQIASQRQLDNLAQINQQLREQLDRSQLPTNRENCSNFSSTGSGRSWLGGPNSERTSRATSRENHQSTPKSQLRINWQVMGGHLQQKKKVFL